MLDCRSLEYDSVPIPPNIRLVICNTMVRHNLAAGEYNRRRADCETGVRAMQHHLPNVIALRDVTLCQLEMYRDELPQKIYQRCRHVVHENERVLEAAEALRAGNPGRFGQLMYESHNSLRDDYQVSCRELDLLVELASACDGVLGARMTGGGFGGCTINLVWADAVDRFQFQIRQSYQAAAGYMPETYVCSAAQGAGEW
jgi:galactokinase